MPAAARIDDPITHTEAHSEGITEMLKGAAVGALIGVALIGIAALAVAGSVVTGGAAAPLLIGAALIAGGMVLSMGGKGFLQGTKQGEQKVAVHGQVKTGSGNVTINTRAAAAACLSLIVCDEHGGLQKLAQGSRTVTINGKMASRVGDRSTCDAVIGAGSGNVTIGGALGQCAAIHKEVADWEIGLAQGAIVAGTVLQIVGTILSGVGAIRLITLAPAALRAMMMVRLGAGLLGGVGLGSVGHHFGGEWFGEGSWQQEGLTALSGLAGGFLGDGIASNGPRIIGGIKSGFEGLTEPGGLFGSPELAPAGGPRGVGSGSDPEIVPRPPGSPGMEAWNPPKNEPSQMSTSGGSGGSSSAVPAVEGNPVPAGVSPARYEALGRDPATGGTFRVNEADTALRVEGQEGVTLQRYTPPPGQKGDWIDPASGNVYDGCSPTKAPYFDQQMNNGGYNKSLLKHVDNPSVDKVVVDTHDLGLTAAEEARLDATLNSLTPAQQAKIVRVK